MDQAISRSLANTSVTLTHFHAINLTTQGLFSAGDANNNMLIFEHCRITNIVNIMDTGGYGGNATIVFRWCRFDAAVTVSLVGRSIMSSLINGSFLNTNVGVALVFQSCEITSLSILNPAADSFSAGVVLALIRTNVTKSFELTSSMLFANSLIAVLLDGSYGPVIQRSEVDVASVVNSEISPLELVKNQSVLWWMRRDRAVGLPSADRSVMQEGLVCRSAPNFRFDDATSSPADGLRRVRERYLNHTAPQPSATITLTLVACRHVGAVHSGQVVANP